MKCQITCHGQTKTVDMVSQESFLEAALRAGLEPPYSCLEGVCGTCEARVEKGEVISPLETTSDSSNLSSHLNVKTCMTRPKSDTIINYDKI